MQRKFFFSRARVCCGESASFSLTVRQWAFHHPQTGFHSNLLKALLWLDSCLLIPASLLYYSHCRCSTVTFHAPGYLWISNVNISNFLHFPPLYRTSITPTVYCFYNLYFKINKFINYKIQKLIKIVQNINNI